MRVLVVSNFYPPEVYGGYELGCKLVVDALGKRGHEVTVLTSGDNPKRGASMSGVARVQPALHNSFAKRLGSNRLFRFLRSFWYEVCNRWALRRVLSEERSDLIYFWNLSHTSSALPRLRILAGLPVVIFVFDHGWTEEIGSSWAAFQRQAERSRIKRLLYGIASFCFQVVGLGETRSQAAKILGAETGREIRRLIHYPNVFLKERHHGRGDLWGRAEIVGWGVDPDRFSPAWVKSRPLVRSHDGPLRLLFVGQVAEHKGLHRILEEWVLLPPALREHLLLTVVGRVFSSEYKERILSVVAAGGIGDLLEFREHIPSESLPAVYREHHVLIFPSLWEEPMGIVPIEAMASGLAVISSGRGGSSDFVTDGTDGLLFDPDVNGDLARQLERLLNDPMLRQRLGKAARKRVEESYVFDHTIDRIESSLKRAMS